MNRITLTIDTIPVTVDEGKTILQAAQAADIYIPTLCHHPALPVIEKRRGAEFVYRGNDRFDTDDPAVEWDGCGICAVDIDGKMMRACATEVMNGMSVITSAEHIRKHRQQKISSILETHPHACLTCSQAEGCPRTQCSSNVPEEERCCELLGACELQRVAQYIGIPQNLPRYRPRGFPVLRDDPLFIFNTELCIGCLRCVRACVDLRGVGTLSFVTMDGTLVVGSATAVPRSESDCRFCGACVEVCPTGALMDTVRAIGDERSKTLVPCRNGCPAGIDIPSYVRYIAKGEFEKAMSIVRERIPLTLSISHVCFHPCEQVCRRSALNQPVSVCRLKRFAAMHDDADRTSAVPGKPDTGKNVVVIGAGPAGLTAAYFLALQGHAVTVHEALPEPGGMLRVGIPEYRLPLEYLQRDIHEIEASGVRIECNSPIDEARFETLKQENDAVFVASGAHNAKRIAVPGSDAAGVYWGVEFLRDRAMGTIASDSFSRKNVVVVGGGNVAIDSARVALRLGALQVRIVCLESPEELPAWDWEVQEAMEETISFTHGFGPKETTGRNGTVSGLIFKRCTRVFDEQGRFNPAYDETQLLDIETDAVILAIGQDTSSGVFSTIGLDPSGRITTDKKTLETQMKNVYAGGDVVRGPSSVIEAIAMGRAAAAEIDKALGGAGDIDRILVEREPVEHHLGTLENFALLERRQPAHSDPGVRISSFCEVENTFTQEDAQREAIRCLSCDLRLAIASVRLPPVADSVLEIRQDIIEQLPGEEGVYQLLDADKQIISIKGVMNLRTALAEVLADCGSALYFAYEKEPMYTKRESELIQQYLQKHGKLPSGGDDDLDDLF